MAKLTIYEASRVAGVARSTLHRAIKQGRLSVEADGRVDTAELLRAGYTLQRSVQQQRGGALQDATPRSTEARHPRAPTHDQDMTALQQERDLLRMERDLLRRELAAAEMREQAALAREQEAREERQAAREHEALLLRMVEQMQQRYDRLLEAPRSVPSMPASSSFGVQQPSLPRGERRRRIVALVREHPEGLSPAEARRLLGVDKDLGSTMKSMARDGLLRRVEIGRYVV
jgi:hypothetical protein